MVGMHSDIILLHLCWTSVQDSKLNTRKMCRVTETSVNLRQVQRLHGWLHLQSGFVTVE